MNRCLLLLDYIRFDDKTPREVRKKLICKKNKNLCVDETVFVDEMVMCLTDTRIYYLYKAHVCAEKEVIVFTPYKPVEESHQNLIRDS